MSSMVAPGLGSGALGLPPFIPSVDGLSKLVPGIPSVLPTTEDLTGLGGLLGGGIGGLGGLLGGFGGSSTTASNVQKTAVQKESGSFKWVEEFLTPEMFASPDSCLIGIGKSTYSANQAGGEFTLLGVCTTASFNSQSNIYTLKELRQESTRMIAMKSGPGMLHLSRMLTSNATILGKLTGKNWAFDTQTPGAKKLFGVVMIFMSPDRKSTYSTLYFERCLISGVGVSVNAGQYQLTEAVSIQYNRVRDTSANDKDSGAPSEGTNWINQVGREGGTAGLGYAPTGNTSTTSSSSPSAGGPPATKPPAGNENPPKRNYDPDLEMYGPQPDSPEERRIRDERERYYRYKIAEENTPY